VFWHTNNPSLLGADDHRLDDKQSAVPCHLHQISMARVFPTSHGGNTMMKWRMLSMPLPCPRKYRVVTYPQRTKNTINGVNQKRHSIVKRKLSCIGVFSSLGAGHVFCQSMMNTRTSKEHNNQINLTARRINNFLGSTTALIHAMQYSN
jgi:hypothetical protein